MRIGFGEKRINIVAKFTRRSTSDLLNQTHTEEARRINKTLDGFMVKAFDYRRELMTKGKEITFENVKVKW